MDKPEKEGRRTPSTASYRKGTAAWLLWTLTEAEDLIQDAHRLAQELRRRRVPDDKLNQVRREALDDALLAIEGLSEHVTRTIGRIRAISPALINYPGQERDG